MTAPVPEDHFCLRDIPASTVLDGGFVRHILDHPPILMHGGMHFGIRQSRYENAFTQHSLDVEPRQPDSHGVTHYPEADLEARALAAMYRLHGHPVLLMPSQPGALDGIFCTDSDKSFQQLTKLADGRYEAGPVLSIMPRFTHEERQSEVPWKERLLRTSVQNPDPAGQRRIVQMAHAMEFGDTRVVFHHIPGAEGGVVLAGLAETTELAMGRSTQEGHREFADYLHEYVNAAIQVITIHLRQPFYHMDTTGPTAKGGHLFTHSAAYTPESWDTLKALFGDKLVEIPLDDIQSGFGGNATSFGRRIYMSDAVSDRAVQMITERGYDVILTPIPHTMKGGGGHRCMTSTNPHYYIQEGYHPDLHHGTNGMVWQVTIDYQADRITLYERGQDGKLSNGTDISHVVSSEEW